MMSENFMSTLVFGSLPACVSPFMPVAQR